MEAKHIKYVISQAIYFYMFEFSKDIILMHDIASFNVIRKEKSSITFSGRFYADFLCCVVVVVVYILLSTSVAFYGKVYITLDLTFFISMHVIWNWWLRWRSYFGFYYTSCLVSFLWWLFTTKEFCGKLMEYDTLGNGKQNWKNRFSDKNHKYSWLVVLDDWFIWCLHSDQRMTILH